MKTLMAVHAIEYGTNGKRVEVQPGELHDFDDKTYDDLIKRGAAREPTQDELDMAELIASRSGEVPAAVDPVETEKVQEVEAPKEPEEVEEVEAETTEPAAEPAKTTTRTRTRRKRTG